MTLDKPMRVGPMVTNITKEVNPQGGYYNHTEFSEAAQAVIMTIEALLGLVIIIINILVLIAFCRSHKLRRRTTNFYLLQLAVSDFVTGCFVFFHIAFAVSPILRRSEYGCLLYYCLMMQVCTTAMFTLIAITVDRFVAIAMPFYYRVHATQKRATIYCAVIHAVPFLLCIIIPLAWHETLVPGVECEMVNILKLEYLGYILIPCFLLLLLIKIILYVVIFHVSRQRVRGLTRLQGSVQNKEIYAQQREKALHLNVNLAKTGALVVGIFLFCWMPYFVVLMMQVYGNYDDPRMNHVRMAAFLFLLLSSILNPIIYIFRITALRREVLRLLHPHHRHRNRRNSNISMESFSFGRNLSQVHNRHASRVNGMQRSQPLQASTNLSANQRVEQQARATMERTRMDSVHHSKCLSLSCCTPSTASISGRCDRYLVPDDDDAHHVTLMTFTSHNDQMTP